LGGSKTTGGGPREWGNTRNRWVVGNRRRRGSCSVSHLGSRSGSSVPRKPQKQKLCWWRIAGGAPYPMTSPHHNHIRTSMLRSGAIRMQWFGSAASLANTHQNAVVWAGPQTTPKSRQDLSTCSGLGRAPNHPQNKSPGPQTTNAIKTPRHYHIRSQLFESGSQTTNRIT